MGNDDDELNVEILFYFILFYFIFFQVGKQCNDHSPESTGES